MNNRIVESMRSKILKAAVAALITGLMCIVGNAHSNEAVGDVRETRFYAVPPDPEELAQFLFPLRTRSIVLNSAEPPVAVEKTVAMPILFHFGKTTITRESQPFLDQVGKMMQQERLANEVVVIEGHTDAVGTHKNNHRLSELRALAVKRYLVNNFGIDPLRLFPEGKGETMLHDTSRPLAGVNRRVEFLPFRESTAGS